MQKILPGLRATIWVHFVYWAIVGLGYLLFPEATLRLVGVQIGDAVPWRVVGAAICAFAASSWWVAHETAWERAKIVVKMEIVWNVLATLVQAYAVFAMGYPPLTWVGVVIMALFAIAFGYFYTLETAVTMAAAPD